MSAGCRVHFYVLVRGRVVARSIQARNTADATEGEVNYNLPDHCLVVCVPRR